MSIQVRLEGCRGPVPITNPFDIKIYEQIDFKKGEIKVIQTHLKFKIEIGLSMKFLSTSPGLYVIGHGWSDEGLVVVILSSGDIQLGEGCPVCSMGFVQRTTWTSFRFIDTRDDKSSPRVVTGDPKPVEN